MHRVTIAVRRTSFGRPVHVIHDPPPATREWETAPGDRRYTTTIDIDGRTVRVGAAFKRGDLYDRPRFELTVGSWDGEVLRPEFGRPSRYVLAHGLGFADRPDVDVVDAGLVFVLARAESMRQKSGGNG